MRLKNYIMRLGMMFTAWDYDGFDEFFDVYLNGKTCTQLDVVKAKILYWLGQIMNLIYIIFLVPLMVFFSLLIEVTPVLIKTTIILFVFYGIGWITFTVLF